MAGKVLFNEGGLKIFDAGDEIHVEVIDPHGVKLIEGVARRAGLVMRRWVRDRKEARGDTPRGRAEAERRRARAEAGRQLP